MNTILKLINDFNITYLDFYDKYNIETDLAIFLTEESRVRKMRIDFQLLPKDKILLSKNLRKISLYSVDID
jgi:hypothetical protein